MAGMQLFLDSARLDELRGMAGHDGVTTNPTLLKKAVEIERANGNALNLESYLEQFLREAGPARPVSLEVVGLTAMEMYNEGRKLYERFNPVAGNVVVKIPICTATPDHPLRFAESICAIRALSSEGIPVNVTLIMRPEQALIAALYGAPAYVSPFAGRLDDLLRDRAGLPYGKSDYYCAVGRMAEGSRMLADGEMVSGVDLVSTIAYAYRERGIPTKVLAASLRNPTQVAECEAIGAHCATLPPDVLREYIADRAVIGGANSIRPVVKHEELFERLVSLPADVFALDNLPALLHHEKTVEGVQKFTADIVPEYAALLR